VAIRYARDQTIEARQNTVGEMFATPATPTASDITTTPIGSRAASGSRKSSPPHTKPAL
jgi:hypothetical protein